MKRFFFLLAVVAMVPFVLTSCDNDDDGPFREISVTIPNDYIVGFTSQYWIFITDLGGLSVDHERITAPGVVVLRIPARVEDETVTLNFLSATTAGFNMSKNLVSFGGIAPGSYEVRLSPPEANATGQAKITLENLPGDVDLALSGDAGNYDVNGNVIETEIKELRAKPSVLLSAFNNQNGEGRYKFMEVEDGNMVSLDYSTLSLFSESQIPAIGDSGFVSQFGYKNEIEYGFRNSSLDYHDGSMTMYGTDEFDSYFTTIGIYDHEPGSENQYIHTNVRFGSAPPTSFTKLDITADLAVNLVRYFTIYLTGEADVVEINSVYTEEGDFNSEYRESRIFYLPFESTVWFHHPQLPEEIEKYTAGFKDFHTVKEITVVDYEEFDGYGDFINYRLRENSFTGVIRSNAKMRTVKFE